LEKGFSLIKLPVCTCWIYFKRNMWQKNL